MKLAAALARVASQRAVSRALPRGATAPARAMATTVMRGAASAAAAHADVGARVESDTMGKIDVPNDVYWCVAARSGRTGGAPRPARVATVPAPPDGAAPCVVCVRPSATLSVCHCGCTTNGVPAAPLGAAPSQWPRGAACLSARRCA